MNRISPEGFVMKSVALSMAFSSVDFMVLKFCAVSFFSAATICAMFCFTLPSVTVV